MTTVEVALEAWEGAPPEVWRDRWRIPGLHAFRAVDSTSDIARALAVQGAPEHTVVLADEQLRGRGRRGRTWHAPPGQGLLLSMVLRPPEPEALSVLPLRIGLAVARAIEAEAPGLRVGIKWPNDLVVADRKLGGILCEAAIEGGRPLFVVAGIGLNVRQRDDDWPADLAGRAASIEAAAGHAVDRAALAGRVITVVCMAADAGGRPLSPEELDALGPRDTLRGRAVRVDGRPAGTAAGIAPDGALLVEREGALHSIVSGTVRVDGT